MNNILQLKSQFYQRKNPNKPGPANLPVGKTVKGEHIVELTKQLKDIMNYWEENTEIEGALVSVHYNTIVAKSNRIKIFLAEKSHSPIDSIRGAKFVWEPDNSGMIKQKHVFTHYVSLDALRSTIENLQLVAEIVKSEYSDEISFDHLQEIGKGNYHYEKPARTAFAKYIVDAYHVERFDVDKATDEIKDESIVTIYKTVPDTKALLRKLGIDIVSAKMIDDTTLRLSPDEIQILLNSAPYLIAMSITDFSKISKYDIVEDFDDDGVKRIPDPTNEPVVGVIDTQFDKSVYFSNWVEYTNLLSSDIELSKEDYFHGTAVSSIIVDGPSFNPDLDDGCGRFRVRHFGVATARGFSSFTILKLIREIVATNRDIKVWNLSLGSILEIKPNFISPEAAELDKIQSEYEVIFVVAGTNDTKRTGKKKIGAPADSLNSIVVNATDFNKDSASYTRTGPVLSFFHKPDISYYGGDRGKGILVCGPMGGESVTGTSFAAPWITRKMAYLMHIMGFSRELAKAILIDSAAGWDRKDDVSHKMGYGVVPVKIRDILHTPDDEIKFMMTGIIEEYETYMYNIPVPQIDKGFPFFAKATLVYFPKCDRNQGVDYTSTEMDIHIGRVQENGKKVVIKPINNNKQSEEGLNILYEEDARKMYRKWDNVKHIAEELKENARPRKVYSSGLWGLSIKTKERMQGKAGKGLNFGVIVTLKSIDGENRIDDFIKLCMVRGLLVTPVDVQNQIDIYQQAEEEIIFD